MTDNTTDLAIPSNRGDGARQSRGATFDTLDYLERIEVRGDLWRAYITGRADEVRAQIARLRRFARLRPGRVQWAVNAAAGDLERRLMAIEIAACNEESD